MVLETAAGVSFPFFNTFFLLLLLETTFMLQESFVGRGGEKKGGGVFDSLDIPNLYYSIFFLGC